MMYLDSTAAKDETEIHSPDSLPAEADQNAPSATQVRELRLLTNDIFLSRIPVL